MDDPLRQQLTHAQVEGVAAVRATTTLEALRAIEIEFLGRSQGKVTLAMRQLALLPVQQRRELGAVANTVKRELEEAITKRHHELLRSVYAAVDLSRPGVHPPVGHRHLVTQAISEITAIFNGLGFHRGSYPEVDWEHYAFTALNMPEGHPARDEWETFFVDAEPLGKLGRRVLTPHTSNAQVREMEANKPPIRIIDIGRCYRRQIDASHVPMFHQFEGLMVDRNVTMAHLLGTLDHFIKAFFGSDRQWRIRPYHFQFTEPSIEVDVSCSVCEGKGVLADGATCKLCKSGWLELGGGGMVHPNVLRAGSIDPDEYSGFAFGWGVERCYLMKSGLQIPDIRMLYQNDLRFLQQF